MAQTAIQQLTGLFDFFVGLSGLTVSGTSTVITTALTTAANTAGRNGTQVPVQVFTSTTRGFITTGTNQCTLWNATTRERVKDASGNVAFARLTQAAGVYTATYFTMVGAVETAFTFPSTSIDLFVPYRFEFGALPIDYAIRFSQRYLSEDAAPGGGGTPVNTFSEILTVTALNTVSNLTKTPIAANLVRFSINEAIADALAGGNFSVSGLVCTYSEANAGYPLLTTYRVTAFYPTTE